MSTKAILYVKTIETLKFKKGLSNKCALKACILLPLQIVRQVVRNTTIYCGTNGRCQVVTKRQQKFFEIILRILLLFVNLAFLDLLLKTENERR